MESHNFYKLILFFTISSITIHGMESELNERKIQKFKKELQGIFTPQIINGPEAPEKIKNFFGKLTNFLKKTRIIASPNNSNANMLAPKKRSRIERWVSC